MYSEYLSDNPKCIFEIRIRGRDQKRNVVHVRVPDADYLTSLMYKNLNCEDLLTNDGLGFETQVRELLWPSIEQIIELERDNVRSITISVRLFYWKLWSSKNWNVPDRVHTLFEVEHDIK